MAAAPSSFGAIVARHSLVERWAPWLQRARQWRPVQAIGDVVYGLYFDAVLAPAFRVYLQAPRIGWFGGWYNKPVEDVCSELAPSSAAYWSAHRDECEAILWRRFESWTSTFEFVAWLLLLGFGARYIARSIASIIRLLWRRIARRRKAAKKTLARVR